MSILINGMEMPKDGEKLYMLTFSDGKACASYKPFEWHEVVHVPPHGRLIDADKMRESIRRQAGLLKLMGGDLSKIAETLEKGFLQEIDNAPTVIEADPEEE